MARPYTWLHRTPEIIELLKEPPINHPVYREEIEDVFGIQRREALRLMKEMYPDVVERRPYWVHRLFAIQRVEIIQLQFFNRATKHGAGKRAEMKDLVDRTVATGQNAVALAFARWDEIDGVYLTKRQMVIDFRNYGEFLQRFGAVLLAVRRDDAAVQDFIDG
jgi:nicotinamide mononucleotide adenylyltransferase